MAGALIRSRHRASISTHTCRPAPSSSAAHAWTSVATTVHSPQDWGEKVQKRNDLRVIKHSRAMVREERHSQLFQQVEHVGAACGFLIQNQQRVAHTVAKI